MTRRRYTWNLILKIIAALATALLGVLGAQSFC